MTDREPTDEYTEGGETPHPVKRVASGGFGGAVIGMDIIGALVVLTMMVVVNIDVLGRWLLNQPFQGTVEISEMGIVAMVYLQIAHTIRSRALTRADTLLDFLVRTGRHRIDQGLRMVFNLAGSFVFATIAYGQYPRLISSWTGGYFKGNVGVFTAPVWPLDLIILLGSILASIQFLLFAKQNLTTILSGPERMNRA